MRVLRVEREQRLMRAEGAIIRLGMGNILHME